MSAEEIEIKPGIKSTAKVIETPLSKKENLLDAKKKEREQLAMQLQQLEDEKMKNLERIHALKNGELVGTKVEKSKAPGTSEHISNEIYNSFIDKNEVSADILLAIAEKLIQNKDLSDREKAIFTGRTSEVNELIRKHHENETATGTKVAGVVKTEPKPVAKENIFPEIKKKFENAFGFDPYADLPQFRELEKGGQEAVYKNFGQVQIGLIAKKAEEMFWNMQKSAGTLAKVGNNLRKTFIIESNKDKAKQILQNEGVKAFNEYASAIVENIRTTGLTVSFEGKAPRVEYAHDLNGLSHEQKEVVDTFNRRATKFGDIPREWAFNDAGKIEKLATGDFGTLGQKGTYEETKEKYEQSRKELSGILKEKFSGDEKKMEAYLRQIDNNVTFNQMIANDPRAMNAINFLSDEAASLAKQGGVGLKKAWLPGLSMLAGSWARGSAATAGIANYGMLLIAPAIASLRGIAKGREDVRTTLKNARAGIEQEVGPKGWYANMMHKITNPAYVGMRKEEDIKKDLLAKFQSTTETKKTIGKDKQEVEKEVGMTKKLEIAVNALEKTQAEIAAAKESLATETDEAKKQALEKEIINLRNTYALRQDTISHRLDLIERKQKEGMIDFGKPNEQFINKYNLSNATSRAYALLVASPFGELKESEKKVRRDGKMDAVIFMKRFGYEYEARLKAQGVKFTKAKSELIKQGVYKAFVSSLTFAGLGFAGRSLYDLFQNAPVETQELLKETVKEHVTAESTQLHTGVATGEWKNPLDENTLHWKGAPTPYDEVNNHVPFADPKGPLKDWEIKDNMWTQKSDMSEFENLRTHEIPLMHSKTGLEEMTSRNVVATNGEDFNLRHGMTENFSIKLGEGGVPKNLETVFHSIAVDHMNIEPGATFNEEMGAKSLNVAANLVKLAEGHNVGGASVKAFEAAAHFNPTSGVLEIKDHDAFNTLLKTLNTHANINWKMGVLQKGAVGELDNIKSWSKIIHADGFKPETGIVGHDEIDAKHIADFSHSEVVEKAHAIHHAPLTGGKSNLIPNPDNATDFVPKKGVSPFDKPASRDPFTQAGFDNDFDSTPPPADSTFVPKQGTNPFKQEVIPHDTQDQAPIQQSQNDIIPKDSSSQPVEPKAPVQSSEHVEEVAKEAPKVIPIETQNHDVLAKILGKQDLTKSPLWKNAHDLPVTDVLKQSEQFIRDEAKDINYKKLWAYTVQLRKLSQVSIFENEKLEDYVVRAGKAFTDSHPKETLDTIYKASQTYLTNVLEK